MAFKSRIKEDERPGMTSVMHKSIAAREPWHQMVLMLRDNGWASVGHQTKFSISGATGKPCLTLGDKSMSRKTRFRIVPLSEVPTDGILGFPMTCDEKRRLLGQYDDATLAFSNAVQELRRGIGTSAKDEYERLERISTEARDRSEQTRLALEQHIAVHRC